MQNAVIAKINRWMLPAVLILFICQLVFLPWAVGFTWADKETNPDYTLTYTKNKLTWETDVDKLPDGTVVIDLFDSEYGSTVKSHDGRDVVAPGTANSKTIRLQNNVRGSVTYTAVAYIIKSDATIPLTVNVTADGTATETDDYSLPEGVTQDQVVQAITGTVSGKQRVDFDTAWSWAFEESAQQDAEDTLLGIKGSAAEVSVGLYIVVEDRNIYGGNSSDPDDSADPNNPIRPDVPMTGDNSQVDLYIGLMVISFIMLILLLLDRRREKKSESN